MFLFVAAVLSACSAPVPKNESSSNPTPSAKSMSQFENNLPPGFQMPADSVGKRLLSEYGAVFVVRGCIPPPKIVFTDQEDVRSFQDSLATARESIKGVEIELQSCAMEALRKAIGVARATGKDITPRGTDAAKRDYDGTVELWASRVEPGLKHWVAEGRLEAGEADRIRSLSPFEQVPVILALEEKGIFFAKDLTKTVLHSVAPPGTSQHLSMLALDINQFNDKEVIAILNRHGWYQTVVSDLPHFTYLGAGENELTELGLKKFEDVGRIYWIPDLK